MAEIEALVALGVRPTGGPREFGRANGSTTAAFGYIERVKSSFRGQIASGRLEGLVIRLRPNGDRPPRSGP